MKETKDRQMHREREDERRGRGEDCQTDVSLFGSNPSSDQHQHQRSLLTDSPTNQPFESTTTFASLTCDLSQS